MNRQKTSSMRLAFALCAIVFSFLFTKVGAQAIEWGNPQKLRNKNLFTQVIGETSEGLYLLRCKNNDFSSEVIIEKYKTNLTLEISINLPLAVNGLIERVLLVNNEIFVFISARNLSTNTIDILAHKLDASLKPVDQAVVICSFPAAQYLERRKIQIKTNAAKTMVGIMFLTKADEGSKLHLYAYQGATQQVFGKQFSLAYPSKEIFITAFDLDNLGNAFVLIDYPKEKPNAGEDTRSFNLYCYYPETDKMLGFELGEGKLFIEELGMVVNNFNQTISVFGFYASSAGKQVDGYFFERYSTKNRQLEQRYANLVDPELLDKLVSGRMEKASVDLRSFYIRKIIAKSDGGVFVAAEKFSRVEQRYSYYLNNMPMEGVKVIYNYDEVALVSINPNGTLQFIDPIRKKQSSVGETGSAGICIIPTLDFIHILYNSELDKDGNVMLHSVNYQGKAEEKILIKNTSFAIAIIPSEAKQTAASTLVASTIKDKLFTLVKVNF
jgi:hypothetical protein